MFTVDICGIFTVSYATMDFRNNLISAFNAYCAATGLAPATVSTKAANDGKFYDSLVAGAGLTIKRYQKVMDWFKANMPTDESEEHKTTKKINKRSE